MRKMYERIKETSSAEHDVTSFVPQGSVIAPLFFISYINDICNLVKHSKMLMYADDLTLYEVVNNAHDACLLQCDFQAISDWAKLLQAISDWAKSWLLEINLSICKVLHFGYSITDY